MIRLGGPAVPGAPCTCAAGEAAPAVKDPAVGKVERPGDDAEQALTATPSSKHIDVDIIDLIVCSTHRLTNLKEMSIDLDLFGLKSRSLYAQRSIGLRRRAHTRS